MAEAIRVILYFAFGAIALTLVAYGLMWWFEPTRRLGRAITTALGKPADATVYDLSNKRAAGMDFTAGDLAVMWDQGLNGLVFSFEEIEGAELIVDERVVARAQKGEARRVLNETHADASSVILRLMLDDVTVPEFELKLFGELTSNPIHPRSASEAVRLGRKWLSHVDAVIKRTPSSEAGQPLAAPAAPAPAAVMPASETTPSELPPWEDDGFDDTPTDQRF